jgi:hypothetical protein
MDCLLRICTAMILLAKERLMTVSEALTLTQHMPFDM